MKFIPFGEYLPDHADLGNPGLIDVQNALPSPSGYMPFKSFVAETDSLTDRPLAAINAIDESGEAFQYAADATDLYENVDGEWTVRTRSDGMGGTEDYTTGPSEIWEFAIWKNKVLATNFSDNPQQATFGDTAFDELTSDLRARRIAVVRDFVVMGNTFDSTDGEIPYRVRWSAFNDETDYTVSTSTLSGFQDLKVSKIQRIFGGEYGVIFQPDRVWRMTFVGAPNAFQFDEVLSGVGLISPRAAARAGNVIYFWSNQGFYALEQGSRAIPIGAGRVDRFASTDLDDTYTDRITAVADPAGMRVYFAYPGAGSEAGAPNRILVYDRALDKWSRIEENVELLWSSAGTNTTLDAAATEGDPDLLDIEGPGGEVSFDDPRWVGGAPSIAAFNHDYASGFFDGANKVARFDTREEALNPDGRARLNGLRAIVDGGTVTAQVGVRNSQSGQASFGPVLNVQGDNRFTTRSNARYHRFRISVSGNWKQAMGVALDRKDIRSGGMRG